MGGWIGMILWWLGWSLYGMKQRPRKTMSAYFRKCRARDPIGAYILWIAAFIYATWHFFGRDEPA
jgi:hypothetical protein